MKLGFLINPVAGMGGSVGLKGTDGKADLALLRGAKPLAGIRAGRVLELLENKDMCVFTCGGEMGESVLKQAGFKNTHIVYSPGQKTTADDTKEACSQFIECGVDLIVFCGGDGTARDVFSVVGAKIPVLGIPSGVKMHSGVFAVTPKAASQVIRLFCAGAVKILDTEVMDIDEDAYRDNILKTQIFGYARTPYVPALVQGAKQVFYSETEEDSKSNIARFAAEFMRDGSMCIGGAGSTRGKMLDVLGGDGTLLGVDIVKNGMLVAKDVSEAELLETIRNESHIKIIVSPIGAQGFILGRGSQQISSLVLQRVGIEHIIIVATPYKLSQTQYLLVDSGDEEIDKKLSGSRQVVCGYRLAQRKEVRVF